jgi:hypothetical protein
MAKTFTSGEVLTASDVNVNLATFMPMIPTSVVGTGVAYSTTTGLVTLTAASTISLNGVFTSTYSRYVIQYDFPTTSANLIFTARLRASNSDNSSAVYDRQSMSSRGADATNPTSFNSLAQTSWTFGAVSTSSLHFGSLELVRPATATPTMASGQSFATLNPATAATTTSITQFGGLHRTAAAYDGITFITSAGNATGTIKVYAYN